MSEMKPTPGRAFCKRDGFSTVYVDVRIGGGMLQEVAACGPTANGPDEQQANAELIAEAFNVHNVTGMTPSQLLDCLNESQMDAARYRWLRRWKGQEHEPLFTVQHEMDGALWGGDLDAAIDDALSKLSPNAAAKEAGK